MHNTRVIFCFRCTQSLCEILLLVLAFHQQCELLWLGTRCRNEYNMFLSEKLAPEASAHLLLLVRVPLQQVQCLYQLIAGSHRHKTEMHNTSKTCLYQTAAANLKGFVFWGNDPYVTVYTKKAPKTFRLRYVFVMQEPATPLSQPTWSLPLVCPVPPHAAQLGGGRPCSVRASTAFIQHGGSHADRLTARCLMAQARGPA